MSERFSRFSRPTSRNRWKGPVLGCGVVVHAALFTGMWAKGIWDIRKVEAADNEVTISLPASPPAMEAAPKGSPKPAPMARRPPPVVVQPSKPSATPPPEPAGGGGPASPATGGGSSDGVSGTASTGVVALAPPLPPDPVAPPPLPPVPRQALVAPAVLEQQRIAGDKRIAPDATTMQRMAHEGTAQVRGTVRLCLDEQGAVRSTSLARSTGFDDYDAKLEREMRTWRYRPYTVDGVAAPVCTAVTFIYRQR